MRFFIIASLLFILFSLASAMFHLVKSKGQSGNTLRFLTVRIVISVALFMFIILALKMGWIVPHGLIPRTPG
ncbi:MAG: DUF2909 domain-containing protein [Proteobacteria bacterium]|nr:DUF2909 domain-containing protein [Pseudomonadota bacterium]